MSSLAKAIADINRTYGSNTIIYGKDAKNLKIERIQTGIFSLDIEVGGGIPLGRIIHIQGPFSSGKSTIALRIAAAVQRKKTKNLVAYVEVENTMDIDWARKHGVDVDSLILTPDIPSLQATLNIVDELAGTGELGAIIIDSIGAGVPDEELAEPVDKWTQGLKARLVNKFIRKIIPKLTVKDEDGNKGECILVLLNHEYDTMDKYHPFSAPGGHGKDFASSIMLQLRRGDWIYDGNKTSGGIQVGHVMKISVLKNKTFSRARTAEVDFYFSNSEKGFLAGRFDNFKSIVAKAVEVGIFRRKGSWYIYNGQQYQGEDALTKELKKNPDKLLQLKKELFADLRKNPSDTTAMKLKFRVEGNHAQRSAQKD